MTIAHPVAEKVARLIRHDREKCGTVFGNEQNGRSETRRPFASNLASESGLAPLTIGSS